MRLGVADGRRGGGDSGTRPSTRRGVIVGERARAWPTLWYESWPMTTTRTLSKGVRLNAV